MKTKKTALYFVLFAVLTAITFIGCDLTNSAFEDEMLDTRKGPKPSEPVVIVPFGGEEGAVRDLAEEDFIETYYAEEDYVYTYYSEPINFTPYDPVIFTPYVPELFFYESGGERVFVPEGDSQATHKLTGFNTVGEHEVGFRVIGERIIGWVSQTYGLWAGQDQEAGTVTISNDNENFYILIETNDTADLKEVHINIYENQGDLPEKRPAPGQAPYKVENINADSVEVVIPISELENLEDYYFIIHAALVEDAVGNESGESNAGETAYAAGPEPPVYNGKGAWYYVVQFNLNALIELITEPLFEDVTEDVTEELETEPEIEIPEGGETVFAYYHTNSWNPGVSNDFLDYGFNRWGWSMGPQPTSHSLFMTLYAGAGQSDITKGTIVGNAYAYYDSWNQKIKVLIWENNSAYDLVQTHLYIGEEMFPLKNGTPTVAPGQYPYKHNDPSEFTPIPFIFSLVDAYEIPWPNGTPYYLILHAVAAPE